MSLHSIGYLFREGLKSLWKNRTMSIASIGVLIACLLMTGVAALLTLNISATMQSVEGNNVITVYLSSDVPALAAAPCLTALPATTTPCPIPTRFPWRI